MSVQSAARTLHLRKPLATTILLLLSVISFTLLKFFYCSTKNERNEKVALILYGNNFSYFDKYLRDYTVIIIANRSEAENLILTITKEIFNISFYAPIIVLFEGNGNIKGIIIGEPSSLFWEEIQLCINSFNCTPFLAYAVHTPHCDYCPRGGYNEKIEILTKLSKEKTDKLISIVRVFSKK